MSTGSRQLNEPHLPNLRDVLRQTYFDLLQTKDVQDNPTFTYTWLADQFGHFTLGFLPTFVISWVVVTWPGLVPWMTLCWMFNNWRPSAKLSFTAVTVMVWGMNQFVRSNNKVTPLAFPLSRMPPPPAACALSVRAPGAAVNRTVSSGDRVSMTR